MVGLEGLAGSQLTRKQAQEGPREDTLAFACRAPTETITAQEQGFDCSGS